MTAWLTRFGRFWYHFFVGDDWIVAAGVVVALAATYLVSRVMQHSWWIVPTAALILLAASVARAARVPK
ncbi:MAG: hypothetical protein JWR32_1435 [Mycobacterium sp.]|jgi:hypothetical protein|nr:hypothetical protein [Mycobacterium sp.]